MCLSKCTLFDEPLPKMQDKTYSMDNPHQISQSIDTTKVIWFSLKGHASLKIALVSKLIIVRCVYQSAHCLMSLCPKCRTKPIQWITPIRLVNPLIPQK